MTGVQTCALPIYEPLAQLRVDDVGGITELFDFNIPLRWTVAHVYQAVLDKKEYMKELDFAATLAAYIHFKLTDKKIIGIGDAAGIFPISEGNYDKGMSDKFVKLVSDKGYDIKPIEVFPKVLSAGDNAIRFAITSLPVPLSPLIRTDESLLPISGRVPIIVDGGVRSGVDVLKMLALGADAVFIGRPVCVAAIGGGLDGVRIYFEGIRTQLAQAMLLTGVGTVGDINPELLFQG